MSGGFSVFIHLGHTSMEASHGEDFFELPLQRLESGRLTDDCRQRLIAGLRAFLKLQNWRPRPRALVAMGARGVSLRRMNLPMANQEETARLLRLQIESEFPLSPEEMAWGFQALSQNAGQQEVLVAAVKKDVIEGHSQLLGECGLSPFFTLAALARLVTLSAPAPACVVLESGLQTELLSLQNGVPTSIRLVGTGSRDPDCLVLQSNPKAVLAGLQKLNEPLLLELKEHKRGNTAAKSVPWKWVGATAAILLILLFFPYLEAIALKPHLAKKLASIEMERGRLPTIDRELGFLQYLKANQPPYLDTLYLIAKVAPAGTVFDTLTMNRHGDLAVRGKMAGAQQVTELRTKLIEAGWFSSLVVEEQSPAPNHQVTVRMTASLKSAEARKPLALDSAPAKSEEPKK
jgi:hypothetical protein